jgi:hypothetical protein
VPYASYKVNAMGFEQLGSGGYLREYWQEKASWDDADVITVSGASPDLTGIDFTLEKASTISGVVYDATGSNPISRASIGITPSDTPWSYWTYCTDDSGQFTIEQPAGSYKVFARGDRTHCGSDPNWGREFWEETPYWDDADVVTLTVNEPSAVLTFTLEMGGSIAGTVYDLAGTSTIGGGVVLAQSVDELLSSFVCAEGDGSYTIPGLPLGDYKVQAFGYCGADPNYVPEYWREKDNWDDADVVTLSAGNREMTDADFTLELGGVITGQVLMADGVTPVANACVRISSTAPAWNPVNRYGVTRSDGSFTITAVPGGDLYVRTDTNCRDAHPDLQDEWYAAGGSTLDASLADTVTVRSGQTVTSVDFALDVASSATVSPEEGGTLTSTADVTTTLAFPPNAVSEPVTVTLKLIASQAKPTRFSFLGQRFSIEATAQDGTPVTTFSEPFTMTIHYDDDDVAGMDEASLAVHYWNESLEQWEEIPAEVNQDTNTITCVLDHLTDFAVLGEIEAIIYLPIVLRNH